MHLHLISLSLIFLLSACQGNTPADELGSTPIPKDPDSTEPEPTEPEPTVPEPTVPEPTVPEPTVDPRKDFPEVECALAHSPTKPVMPIASSLDYLFFETVEYELFNYKIDDGATSKLLDSGSNDLSPFHAKTPYHFITGAGLSNWQSQDRGFLFATDKLIFANPSTGQLDTVSDLDLTNRKVCKINQRHTTFSRMAEFEIQLDIAGRTSSCDINIKVDLSLGESADFNMLPDTSSEESIAIYDAAGNWQGNLKRHIEEGNLVLAFELTDKCSKTTLFQFDNNTDTWQAQQQSDGSLLLRLGNKVYLLNVADTIDFVKQQNSFTLPSEPLYTFSSFSDEDWFSVQGDYIYFTDNESDSFYSYHRGTKTLSPAQNFVQTVTAPAPEEHFEGFQKIITDDESVWVEVMFYLIKNAGEENQETEYWHRFKRWDKVDQAWDQSAQLDHIADSISSETSWRSINNSVYLKVRAANSLLLKKALAAENYIADYFLDADSATSIVEGNKIWQFFSIDAGFTEKENAVLSIDDTSVDGSIGLEVIRNTGAVTQYSGYDTKALSISIDSSQGDYLIIKDLVCLPACEEGASIGNGITALNLMDGSDVTIYSDIQSTP